MSGEARHQGVIAEVQRSTALDEADRLLEGLPCKMNRARGARYRLLARMRAQSEIGECRAKPGKHVLVARIIGSGHIPHYAGGSYYTEGHHDRVINLDEAPTLDDVGRVLQELYDYYEHERCDARIPAIPGLARIPVVWKTGPFIEITEHKIAADGTPPFELENTWKLDEGRDGPSLSELREGCP